MLFINGNFNFISAALFLSWALLIIKKVINFLTALLLFYNTGRPMYLNIYLAEDDPDDKEFFKDSLKLVHPRSNLFPFDDGEQLMNHLKKSTGIPPDIIFLDINMPRKNGKECLVEIRKDHTFKHIPVIMFTTSVTESDVAFAFQKGANLFVNKPASFLLQMEVLRQILSLHINRQLFNTARQHFVLPSSLKLA